jgi:hypothetical protein
MTFRLSFLQNVVAASRQSAANWHSQGKECGALPRRRYDTWVLEAPRPNMPWATRVVCTLVALRVSLLAAGAAGPKVAEVAGQLDEQKDIISATLGAQLKKQRITASYTVVWRQFEEAAVDALCEELPKRITGLGVTNFDRGKTGHEKNRLADLAVVCTDGTIEISVKAARKLVNPENDLGTFREYPTRKKLFAASFTVWVRYGEIGRFIPCDQVFFDRSWRFAGKSSLVDGVKYRKKDGNMRPKPWAMFDAGQSFWKSEADFEAALKRAEVYRANEVIKEYLDDLSDSDQRLLYERLKPKFATPDSGKN